MAVTVTVALTKAKAKPKMMEGRPDRSQKWHLATGMSQTVIIN